MRLVLKGGRIIDPSQHLDAEMDLLIEKGRITRLGKRISVSEKEKKSGTRVITLGGMVVMPGLIDMHTHLREPGFEYKETIHTGCSAAVAGGFTAIACMPNTEPANDSRSVTEFILAQARLAGGATVYPVAAISKGRAGTVLAEFADLRDAGAVAFSDDGSPVAGSGVMRSALEYAHSMGMPVISHCEDTGLSEGGQMNEGFVSTELGLAGIPSIAEEIMVRRDIAIAEFTGTPVHIAHVSTAGSVRAIREAKKRGIHVTAETAPHYFTLTEEALRGYSTSLKVNPPLRGAGDVEALKKGLRDGTIDAIASDHAPHARTEKDVEFEYASPGIVGLETSLALSLRLVHGKVLTLSQLAEKMSLNPARILGVPKGTLSAGADADVTVIDIARTWRVDADAFRSKSRNTPFHGWEMKGKAVLTIVGGEIKYRDM